MFASYYEWVAIQTLSKQLGLSTNTLYTLVSQGRIPYHKLGDTSALRFDPDEIEKWSRGEWKGGD